MTMLRMAGNSPVQLWTIPYAEEPMQGRFSGSQPSRSANELKPTFATSPMVRLRHFEVKKHVPVCMIRPKWTVLGRRRNLQW